MKRLTLLLILIVSTLSLAAQTGIFFSADKFSNSLVTDLCQDKYGHIWVGTDYGLNRFDGYQFRTYIHHSADTTSLCNSAVVSLLCDRDGQLWVGTNRGLDRYNPISDTFTHYPFPDGLLPRVNSMTQLSDGTILVSTAGYGAYVVDANDRLQLTTAYTDDNDGYYSMIYEDSRHRTWRCAASNLIVLQSGGRFQHFQSSVGMPVSVVELNGEVMVVGIHGIEVFRNGQLHPADIDMSVFQSREVVLNSASVDSVGNMYIGTRGNGLYVLSQGSRTLERASISASDIDLSTSKVSVVKFDRRGNLWAGLTNKGILMVPQRPMSFANWSFSAQNMRLATAVSSVCEGDGGITWCTVQGVGVYGFDGQGRVVAHPAAPSAVEMIFRDRLHRYWIGTDDGLFAYDPLTGRSQLRVTFECDMFNDMTSDDTGCIYISTFSRGFCVYDPATGHLRNYSLAVTDSVRGGLCNDWIFCMMADRNGLIWMGTSSGLSCYDPATDSFRSQGWNDLLSGIMCFSVCELQDGNIVVGTDQGFYLYDRKTRQIGLFPGSDDLSNKIVDYIVQADDGDIWCSTSNGIWQYDSRKGVFVGHISGDGLQQKEYIFGVGMHRDDNMIFFGHNDGFVVFNPLLVNANRPSVSQLWLTQLLVGNTPVNALTKVNDVQVINGPLAECDRIALSYLDHTVTLAFSQLTFDNPANVVLEYRFDGGDWIRNAPGKNDFTLSHLQPGNYTVEVRAMVGEEYTPVKTLYVTVQAPWYRTPLAYCLYLLAILILLGYVFYTYRRRVNAQTNEEKMKFLINATHDIRSPLTLIVSPMEKMKRMLKADDAPVQRKDLLAMLDVMDHNSKRILNLVNQILDVRKIDKQQMHLHCQETDMVNFLGGICKMFEFNAKERNITFTFNHDGIDQLPVWIDRSQFDKVITNLLSNAFKYTYEGGEVVLSLAAGENKAVVRVEDNGVGIDADALKHIFDRFYQGGNSRRFHIDGTGIGLNLCKMIVDMHHGTIEAANRAEGQGSVFEVCLPLGNAHLSAQEVEMENGNTPPTVSAGAMTATGSKRRVLVVDDDLEIGRFISTELGRYYKFGIAPNGKEGLKELLTNPYDVVVSDVMMPEMDGFTLLRMIKQNANVSHVPVIMLTSKADVANRLEGLERGADAFLAKPFDMEELHMNIENLIHNRQRLKGKYSGAQQQADKIEQPEVKGNDELLMERIMKAINKNLSDSDFNVDMLTHEVGISRAQLHRKMKEMTGISTSEFIRNIRLEQAARLLREQKINVTQVAYTVGFSNLAHFSTVFRKHFGVAPSDYAEKKD